MEKRIGTVNPPIIMNTFVNEAFDEGDDKIVENNNSTWGNVNLDEVLLHADMDKAKMSQLLNIPGTPRTRDRKISQICAKVRMQETVISWVDIFLKGLKGKHSNGRISGLDNYVLIQ